MFLGADGNRDGQSDRGAISRAAVDFHFASNIDYAFIDRTQAKTILCVLVTRRRARVCLLYTSDAADE